ncbi:hypothetical protein VMCG_04014 [Cytospora schulzeri]|uniref:Ubiquitin-like protease family profile domain-containing protein n=1 Tax=Cytospora schulzeri TaxID=448051 RepID=A0A423WTV5_9PEZI|nr:hypothetical protein VMCG_04014 [Valsa malicola]
MEHATPNTSDADMFRPEELTLEEKIALLQRPVDSAPPADRVLDQHYKLSTEDIAEIAPGSWLCDKVIQTVFRRLTLLRPGRFYAIDTTSISTMAEIVEDLTEEARREYTRPVITDVAMLTSTQGTVLIPFNVENSHFILVALRLAERAIFIFDSTMSEGEEYRESLEDFVKKRVVWLFNFAPEDISAVHVTWNSVPCPQQGNTFDCGVAVCLTAMHLVSHPETPWTFTRPVFSSAGLTAQYSADSYWLAGRRMILELCRPYAETSVEKIKEALDQTEAAIGNSFAHLTEGLNRPGMFEAHYNNLSQMIANTGDQDVPETLLQQQQKIAFMAVQEKATRRGLSAPVACINEDLVAILNHVRELGTASTVDRDLAIQRQAPNVVVSEAWAEFRGEVARKAVDYAWHDVGEIRKVRDDLARATTSLLRAAYELYTGSGEDVPSLEAVMDLAWVASMRGGGS